MKLDENLVERDIARHKVADHGVFRAFDVQLQEINPVVPQERQDRGEPADPGSDACWGHRRLDAVDRTDRAGHVVFTRRRMECLLAVEVGHTEAWHVSCAGRFCPLTQAMERGVGSKACTQTPNVSIKERSKVMSSPTPKE